MRYLTAGESHGKCLTAIVEGMPANVPIFSQYINKDLARRQGGYGRGGRMKIEQDQVQLLSGVRHNKTLGSPITLQITNKDWDNWQDIMSPEEQLTSSTDAKRITRPRPGHADLTGALKYRQKDMRNILERASARETASRVAVGSIAKQFLDALDINILAHVVNIGGVKLQDHLMVDSMDQTSWDKIKKNIYDSSVMCVDSQVTAKMVTAIDTAKKAGDSLGGVVEVVAINVPLGLGSHSHWDRKLDAKIAFGLMSIQAIKGVEFGLGFEVANSLGSAVHDEIQYDDNKGFIRKSNGAGGIEGGMSNGAAIVVRAAMKPIPTLYKPLSSVDIRTKKTELASIERSDICAVPACAVVAEAVVAWEIAQAIIEKFGGDSLEEIEDNLARYKKYIGEI